MSASLQALTGRAHMHARSVSQGAMHDPATFYNNNYRSSKGATSLANFKMKGVASPIDFLCKISNVSNQRNMTRRWNIDESSCFR